jgi:hypothetical protein
VALRHRITPALLLSQMLYRIAYEATVKSCVFTTLKVKSLIHSAIQKSTSLFIKAKKQAKNSGLDIN